MLRFSPDSATVFAHGVTFQLGCRFYGSSRRLMLQVHRPCIVIDGHPDGGLGFRRSCRLQLETVLAPAVLPTPEQYAQPRRGIMNYPGVRPFMHGGASTGAHRFVGTRKEDWASVSSALDDVRGDHTSLATWLPHMVDGALRVRATIEVTGS